MAADPEWVTRTPDPATVDRLAETLGCSRTLARLLANRDVTEPDAARHFLDPSLDHLHDPRGLPDLAQAVDRVQRALHEDEQILLYADRDIDGIAGCTILAKLLADAGANVGWYVPGKWEGYGVNETAVQTAADRGTDLLVTVDCGTTATAEVTLATSLGMDVLVTDHHDPSSVASDALACVNPRLPDSAYPHEHLAGGAVAFKLGAVLVEGLSDADIKAYHDYALPLAALATLGDYVRLTVENRAIATAGYRRLSDCGLPGLVAAADRCDVASIDDLRWSLLPLLNAAQEAESGDLLLRLLFSSDSDRIESILDRLEDYREERRRQRREQRAHLETCFDRQVDPGTDEPLLYLVETDQYVGGPALSALSSRWGKPVLAYRKQGDTYKGGGRTDPDVDLLALYRACQDHLEDYWGHPGAAGFQVPTAEFEPFRERLTETVADRYDRADLRPTVEIDGVLPPEQLRRSLVEEIRRLEPLGPGNEKPQFLVEGVPITGSETLGADDQHLRPLTPESAPYSLVYWDGAEEDGAFADGGRFDVVGEVGWSDYEDGPQVSIEDFRELDG